MFKHYATGEVNMFDQSCGSLKTNKESTMTNEKKELFNEKFDDVLKSVLWLVMMVFIYSFSPQTVILFAYIMLITVAITALLTYLDEIINAIKSTCKFIMSKIIKDKNIIEVTPVN